MRGADKSDAAFGNCDPLFRFKTAFVVVGVYFCRLHVYGDLVESIEEVCVCVTGSVIVDDFCSKLTNVMVLSNCTNPFLRCMFS